MPDGSFCRPADSACIVSHTATVAPLFLARPQNSYSEVIATTPGVGTRSSRASAQQNLNENDRELTEIPVKLH